MGLLAPSNVEAWRKGLIPYLRELIQGSPEKIKRTLTIFQDWALKLGLEPQEVAYFARTAGPRKELRFIAEGGPEVERVYRTHYYHCRFSNDDCRFSDIRKSKLVPTRPH
jgi:hypothetical protein